MHDMVQGSPEWIAARLGKVTGSRIADATARTKSGWGASRANYMADLIAERLTGQPRDSFSNAAMQWGSDMEATARATYCFMNDVDVVLVGFVHHPVLPMAGASPDGFVGDDGLVEFKCPNTATHIDTLLGASIDGKYIKQMQWQMACTRRSWCDFVSFDPRLPEAMQFHSRRVERDPVVIDQLETEIAEFLKETRAKEDELRVRFGMAEPLSVADLPDSAKYLMAG